VDETGAANPAAYRTEILCVVAAPGWTAHDMAPNNKALFRRLTRAGTKRIYEIPIADNTVNSIIVDTLNIVGNILQTDTLEIVQAGARIEGVTDVGGGITVVMIRGDSGVPGTLVAAPTAASQGCTFERLDLLLPFVQRATTVSFDRCRFLGGINLFESFDVALVNCTSSNKLDATRTRILSASGSRPDSAADPAVTTAGVMLMSKDVQLHSGSDLRAKGPVSAYGAAAAAIIVDDYSVFVQDTAYLGGDSAATTGISATKGGRVQVLGGGQTTVTGAGGDLDVGGVIVAYGTGVGQFEEAAGYNGNLHNTYVDAGGVPHGDFARIHT